MKNYFLISLGFVKLIVDQTIIIEEQEWMDNQFSIKNKIDGNRKLFN